MGNDTSIDPVLITGGSGFLGRHLADDLMRHGCRVVGFDTRQQGMVSAEQQDAGCCEVIPGDILNIAELTQAVIEKNVKSIIHAAAVIPPDSEDRPHRSLEINLLGTCNVLEVARLMKLSRVTFVSSGAVYGTGPEISQENSPIPLDIGYGFYGCAKAAGELIGLNYARNHGLDFVSTRHAAIYGPGGSAPHYLNLLVANAIQGEKTDIGRGGDHRFEFVYVADAVQGLRTVHTAPKLNYNIYNVGTGRTHSLFELAAEIKKVIPAAEIALQPGLLEDLYQRGPFDISRIRSLGYEPEFSLARGLTELIKAPGIRS